MLPCPILTVWSRPGVWVPKGFLKNKNQYINAALLGGASGASPQEAATFYKPRSTHYPM